MSPENKRTNNAGGMIAPDYMYIEKICINPGDIINDSLVEPEMKCYDERRCYSHCTSIQFKFNREHILITILNVFSLESMK